MKKWKTAGILCLALAGCSQTEMSSVVIVKSGYVTDSLRESAVKQVYEKAEELGGSCKEISSEASRHRCTFGSDNPYFSMSVGDNSAGQFVVAINFVYVHWLPPSRESVTSGKYVSAQQIDLENWLKSVVPRLSVERAVRIYGSYEFEQQL